jgi:hypothetical protein
MAYSIDDQQTVLTRLMQLLQHCPARLQALVCLLLHLTTEPCPVAWHSFRHPCNPAQVGCSLPAAAATVLIGLLNSGLLLLLLLTVDMLSSLLVWAAAWLHVGGGGLSCRLQKCEG